MVVKVPVTFYEMSFKHDGTLTGGPAKAQRVSVISQFDPYLSLMLS